MCRYVNHVKLLQTKVTIGVSFFTSVTTPSLFLSKLFINKSEDRNILIKFFLVRQPSSPAIWYALNEKYSSSRKMIFFNTAISGVGFSID